MANDNEQTPDLKQLVGYNGAPRDGSGETDGQTEQEPTETGVENVEQNAKSSEGEPGRSQADTTGGQEAKPR